MDVDETIEVNLPISRVYNQWTQFEEYPHFMEGVKQVEQIDDTRLHWVAEVGGQRKEWYAYIKRQVPDEVLSWESESGAGNSGTVVFHPLGDGRTEVQLHMEIQPEGMKETVGSAMGVPSRQIAGDLMRFKEFIEARGHETGSWRGEIKQGQREDTAS